MADRSRHSFHKRDKRVQFLLRVPTVWGCRINWEYARFAPGKSRVQIPASPPIFYSRVVQLVGRQTLNLDIGGSIPSSRTKKYAELAERLGFGLPTRLDGFDSHILLQYFCADIAQLVEHHVANVNVTGSSPVIRSIYGGSSVVVSARQVVALNAWVQFPAIAPQ